MVVPDGYKQTEVGVIPKDWEVSMIGNLFAFKNGLNKSKEYFGYGTPIVNYTDVYSKNGLYATDINGKVCLSNNEIKRYQIQKGDIFFTRTSETPEEVGISSVLLEEIPNGVFSGFVLRGRPLDNSLGDGYKKYCFQTEHIRNAIIQGCTYTTRALTNGTQLSKIYIPVPPEPEQTAIAEALTDVDSLIESLEKLMAKKKDIKQGAMQELLTGKRRLEGFSGEWKVKNICRIGIFYSGLTGKTKDDFGTGTAKYITFLNVLKNIVIKINILDNVKLKYGEKQNLAKKGDLFFNTSSETPEELGMCSVLLEDVDDLYLNSFCFGFRQLDNADNPLYLSYAFNSIVGRKIMSILAQGATRYNLSKKAFSESEILLPPTLDEQIAIANILSDMDDEIERLTVKLNKYKQIKQGMMQELLTGKRRLI